MKKSLFLALVLVMFIASSTFAAPLDDYSKAGNVGLSVWVMHAGLDTDRKSKEPWGPGFAESFDAANKWSLGGELTVTVAPKWAIGFEYAGTNGKHVQVQDFIGAYSTEERNKLSSSLVKVKYQVYKDERLFLAPYIGFARNRAKINNYQHRPMIGYAGYDYKTESRTSILAGVTAVYALDKPGKLKTYLDAAAGNKMYSWNIGVSYQVAKNLDFDFGYKHYMVKGLKYDYDKIVTTSNGAQGNFVDNGKIKSSSRGIYFGLSYKFI